MPSFVLNIAGSRTVLDLTDDAIIISWPDDPDRVPCRTDSDTDPDLYPVLRALLSDDSDPNQVPDDI